MNTLRLSRAIKILEYFYYVKRLNKNPKTIDLGAGDGRFVAFLGEFCDADALELSTEAVHIAKEQYKHVNFFHGNALTYDFEKDTYDLVISQEVIEHIDNQQAYLDVCYKILKPGGYLIMTTPNKKVFDHLKGGNWSDQPIENILTPKSFKTLIKRRFSILKYDSIILNFGKEGYFAFVNHRVFVGGFKALRLSRFREFLLSKLGFGLHQCVLAKKINNLEVK
jgi:SAM-dependent methyltransferase